MEMIDLVVLALLAGLAVILFLLLHKNNILSYDNQTLKEIVIMKDATIANYEASRVAVTDVIENYDALDEVMIRIKEGESKASISENLNIPLAKIDLIIKFDALKKNR